MFLCFMFGFLAMSQWDLSSLCVLCLGFLAMSHGILAPNQGLNLHCLHRKQVFTAGLPGKTPPQTHFLPQ